MILIQIYHLQFFSNNYLEFYKNFLTNCRLRVFRLLLVSFAFASDGPLQITYFQDIQKIFKHGNLFSQLIDDFILTLLFLSIGVLVSYVHNKMSDNRRGRGYERLCHSSCRVKVCIFCFKKAPKGT